MNGKEQKPILDHSIAIDKIQSGEWNDMINSFSQANIYQTWSYGEVIDKCCSHFVVKHLDKITAIAQIRIVKIPIINVKIAYLRWGPLIYQDENSLLYFRVTLRGLKEEYVRKRKMILRIYPELFENRNERENQIFIEEGYIKLIKEKSEDTLLLSIKKELFEIRKSFKQKWRNCLNHAEKNHLSVTIRNDITSFHQFIVLYNSMIQRKGFSAPNNINDYLEINENLPPQNKMMIFLCYQNENLCSGAIIETLGDTGVYLYGATNETGLKSKGSYLIQWEIIKFLKQKGLIYYNLNGINPVRNPGTYRFKNGMSHKNGEQLRFLGNFECYPDLYREFIMKLIIFIYKIIKKLQILG